MQIHNMYVVSRSHVVILRQSILPSSVKLFNLFVPPSTEVLDDAVQPQTFIYVLFLWKNVAGGNWGPMSHQAVSPSMTL